MGAEKVDKSEKTLILSTFIVMMVSDKSEIVISVLGPPPEGKIFVLVTKLVMPLPEQKILLSKNLKLKSPL